MAPGLGSSSTGHRGDDAEYPRRAGDTLATSFNTSQRDQLEGEALTDQNETTRANEPPPTDPDFYGRGLAYAIFVSDDTLRTGLECPPAR